MTETVTIGTIPTPLGTFGAVLSAQGLCRLTFPAEPFTLCEAFAQRWLPGARPQRDDPRLASVATQLVAYLHGDLRDFTLPVDLRGTPFQVQVWKALQTIPHAEVRSYADIAAAVGRPRAVRAVGAANGANPVPIIVPCHRVIGSNGRLVGYGGGTDLKRHLLQLEGLSIPD